MPLTTSEFTITSTWQEVGAGSTVQVVIEPLSPRNHFQYAYGDSAPTAERAGHPCYGRDPVTCDSESGARIWVRVFGNNPSFVVRVSAE